MAKGGVRPKKAMKIPKNPSPDEQLFTEQDMDDEIDAFHKQRDVVRLDVDEDIGDDSDEDMEQPVLDFEDDADDDFDDDDGDNDEDSNYDAKLTGFAAKIARQEKFLRRKIGGVEDETHDDVEGADEEDEEEGTSLWGRSKSWFYGADNVNDEIDSSDEEALAMEEAEAMRMWREKAKMLDLDDFGLEGADQDDNDSDEKEKTQQDLLGKESTNEKHNADEMAKGGTSTTYEVVKKDFNALTKEEKMDVLLSSAPEVVGLLSELNDALDQLENKVNPLLSKVEEENATLKGREMHYLKVKQLLLLAYCQSISFYLLLKSEGHPVRDHPILARLVEINNMLQKMKKIDEQLPFQINEILNQEFGKELGAKEAAEFEPCTTNQQCSIVSSETCETTQASELPKLMMASTDDTASKSVKRIRQNIQVGPQSMEMLKVRATLEEKLKQKGLYRSTPLKPDRSGGNPSKLVNRRLETLTDFDDEVWDKDVALQGVSNGGPPSLHLGKLSQLAAAKVKKPKVVSGDDDLPTRDDIGERRRKYEHQVLVNAGVPSMDDIGDDEQPLAHSDGVNSMDIDDHISGESQESEDEFYKEAKRQRAAKLSAKADIYARTPVTPSLPEDIDVKRHITYQMEKNKGLTRARKKLTKIPRKKYKLKHKKALVRRKGQVREIKRSSGAYGGEVSGINTGISRSVRFKS